MNNTLGLDLGSNSLGWAILNNDTGAIESKGVVVFPEGIDAANDTLETPAAIRRSARMARRMKFRRKLRKWKLLEILIGAKMCPLSIEDLQLWKKQGVYPVTNEDFIHWLRSTDTSNPYCDRNAAASGKVQPFTLGRALYHICQRRGFRSSRKEEASLVDATTGEKEESADKQHGAVKSDIAALSAEIKAEGCRTLGQYFFKRLESEKEHLKKSRVRCRYTGRIEHYEAEFNAIMEAQGYPEGDDLRKKLHNAIFWQRHLRSQAHLVGNCPLEPHNPRAQISHPAVEEFRMRTFINNLMLEDQDGQVRDEQGNALYPLTTEDKNAICREIGPMKAPTFKSIYKLFKKDPRFSVQGLRFHYYDDSDTVPSCPMRSRISSAFGNVPYDEQTVFDALTFYNDETLLACWFRKHYPALDEKSIPKLVSIYPKEGNANYSLKAIKRMLPFLRLGLELFLARFCAKLPDVISDFDAHAEEIILNLRELILCHHREKAIRAAMPSAARKNLTPLPSLFERFENYLLNNFNVTKEKWNRLYLTDGEEYQPETMYFPHGKNGKPVELKTPRLPPVRLGMIRNPLVQRSMTTLRRLVNYLNEHGLIDTETTIRIELARNVNDFATRQALVAWQKIRKATREKAVTEITRAGVAPTEDAIERYVLWMEQDGKCLYTGKTIPLADLLSGNKFDIEHTIPRSLSGDDSLANKTICDAVYNRQLKRGRIPRDCPNADEILIRLKSWREKLDALDKNYRNQNKAAQSASTPDAHSRLRIKALTTRIERDYWRDKLRRFDVTADRLVDPEGGLSGFKKRQLVDTGIMCSHAVKLLKCLFPKTFPVNGAATALARKAWGIQSDEVKDRSEHTHHAKDAMVIAALTPARFNRICTALKDDTTDAFRRPCDVCQPPWPDFAENVRKAVDEILVKHILRQTTLRQSSKRTALAKAHPLGGVNDAPLVKFVLSKGDTVRVALHKDSLYGCIAEPQTGNLKKVIRKPLVGPVKAAEAIVNKIVDPAIRSLVVQALIHLKEKGIKNIEPGMITMPSGVPVNKVRVYAPNATNAQVLKPHDFTSKKAYKNPYYVTSAEGSNFRLALFNNNGKLSVKADNSLVWAQNHKKPDYTPFDRMEGFVGYIMPGTMALTHAAGDREEVMKLSPGQLRQRLYKLVKFTSNGQSTFRFQTEARASVVLEQALKASGKHAKGESKIDLEHPHELLLVSPGTYLRQMLFEGIDFAMNQDGSIRFFKE